MQVARICFALSFAVLCIVGSAHAQGSRVDFSAGGGFSEPVGHAGNNVDSGWNVDFRGGYKPTPHLALDLDFNYNHWNLNNAALARYGEPGGYTTIWSFSFLSTIHGSPHWHVAPYAMAGPGIYYRNLTLTQPGLVNTIFCDPFLGSVIPRQLESIRWWHQPRRTRWESMREQDWKCV